MKQSDDSMPVLRMILTTMIIPISLAIVVAAPSYSADESTSLCNIQHGSCIKNMGDGMIIEFDIQPKPVASMTESQFVVTLSRNGIPITDASVHLDLSMPDMYMGKNQPAMNHIKAGRYEGKSIITRCASGRKTWQADVFVGSAGKTAVATIVFEVK
jgi:hypothetical protein